MHSAIRIRWNAYAELMKSGRLGAEGAGEIPPEISSATYSGCVPRICGSRGERNPKKSDGVLRNGCSAKYAWIAAQGKAFALPELCDVREDQRHFRNDAPTESQC